MTSLHWNHQKRFVSFFLSEELQDKFQNHVRYPLQKIFQKHQTHKFELQHSFESPNNEYVNPFDSLLLHCYKIHQAMQDNVKHYLTTEFKSSRK